MFDFFFILFCIDEEIFYVFPRCLHWKQIMTWFWTRKVTTTTKAMKNCRKCLHFNERFVFFLKIGWTKFTVKCRQFHVWTMYFVWFQCYLLNNFSVENFSQVSFSIKLTYFWWKLIKFPLMNIELYLESQII